ncbi:MAG: DUF4442 domain-containing protein [Acidobacteriota bacterium]
MKFNDLKLRLLGLYPPFLGAGISARRVPNGWESNLRLSLLNRNYFGTHFGGSLYAMCDPFFALILAERLGPGYVVWDKAATIRFLRPGRGRVTARFEIEPERVDAIRRQVERDGKCEPAFDARVLDQAGLVVAEVDKLLYVRLRDRPSGFQPDVTAPSP